jgi:hypothetical protein
MSPGREIIVSAMEVCLKAGRQYQMSDPHRALEELGKLRVLSTHLRALTNFEEQLVSAMDVD